MVVQSWADDLCLLTYLRAGRLRPLKQQRILSMAPLDVTGEDLASIFRDSVENW